MKTPKTLIFYMLGIVIGTIGVIEVYPHKHFILYMTALSSTIYLLCYYLPPIKALPEEE